MSFWAALGGAALDYGKSRLAGTLGGDLYSRYQRGSSPDASGERPRQVDVGFTSPATDPDAPQPALGGPGLDALRAANASAGLPDLSLRYQRQPDPWEEGPF